MLLGWPLQDITVRVEVSRFEGSHEIEQIVEGREGYSPLLVDRAEIDDHFPCIFNIVGMSHFYVGVVS